MKYLSIDIETTGLDRRKHDILEVAAVWDINHALPVEDLPQFRALCLMEEYSVTPYCIEMHKKLWLEILHAVQCVGTGGWENGLFELNGDEAVVIDRNVALSRNIYYVRIGDPCTLRIAFEHWLRENGWDGEKLKFAGKNAAMFDIPWLAEPQYLGDFKWSHRHLDPAMLYIEPGDESPPSLGKCLERAGMRPTELHTGLGDAIDVVRLLRHKVKFGGPIAVSTPVG